MNLTVGLRGSTIRTGTRLSSGSRLQSPKRLRKSSAPYQGAALAALLRNISGPPGAEVRCFIFSATRLGRSTVLTHLSRSVSSGQSETKIFRTGCRFFSLPDDYRMNDREHHDPACKAGTLTCAGLSKESGHPNEKANLRNQHYPGWLRRSHETEC